MVPGQMARARVARLVKDRLKDIVPRREVTDRGGGPVDRCDCRLLRALRLRHQRGRTSGEGPEGGADAVAALMSVWTHRRCRGRDGRVRHYCEG